MNSRRFLIAPLVRVVAAVALASVIVACSGLGTDIQTAATRGHNCPTSPPAPLPAGETRIVTIETTLGKIRLKVEGDLAPNAAANFVALAGCGFYDGIGFHRVVPGFVIQGGDPNGTGGGGPGYKIQDDPVRTPYLRGTLAMARTKAANSAGSQFFIVVDDAAADRGLAEANTYAIFGAVTDGMDVVDAIVDAADAEHPSHPVTMTKVTVSTP
ncbi:MAG: peptidylprolyl isomerase [Candidatus Limnocylindrales bacterium]